MHPKFVVVDRRRVFVPSCNVSWEEWFEGCVELRGGVVGRVVEFWVRFWGGEGERGLQVGGDGDMSGDGPNGHATTKAPVTSPSSFKVPKEDIPTVFLPSPHHRHPQFALFPWRPCPAPPSTPLNTFILSLLSQAKKDIYIQTPNLTCPPVLTALLSALKRGVDVSILTSERLMILEQLGTAGTTTSRCVKKLMKRHRNVVSDWRKQDRDGGDSTLVESGISQPGKLEVSYYRPNPAAKKIDGLSEPVQSHLKLTIVDERWTVLGSGNMDRASWFTSQELGVAFWSRGFASEMKGRVDSEMAQRRRKVV